jgi:hypothetical protein
MRNELTPSGAGRDYEAAHNMHYKTKNLDTALGLYQDIIGAHPDSDEAAYSRTQIQNIAKSLVPKDELMLAEIKMARAHIEPEGTA